MLHERAGETTRYVPSLAAVATKGKDGTDGKGKGLLRVYLSKRYAKLFTNEELQGVQPDTLYLQYNGQEDRVLSLIHIYPNISNQTSIST